MPEGLTVWDGYPALQAGQYWAYTTPFTMFRIENGESYDLWSVYHSPNWTVKQRYDISSNMVRSSAVYLWYYNLAKNHRNFRTGDVVMTPTGQLWFVGPETTEEYVAIHANWIVTDRFLAPSESYPDFYQFVSRLEDKPSPEGDTRYDKLRREVDP